MPRARKAARKSEDDDISSKGLETTGESATQSAGGGTAVGEAGSASASPRGRGSRGRGSGGGAEAKVGQKRGAPDASPVIAGKGEDADIAAEKLSGQPGVVQGDNLLQGVGKGMLHQVLYTIPHPPKARTLAELRIEAAARYSVPPENLRILSKDGKELDLATELTSLMEPFKVWITENTGIVKEWVFWFNHENLPLAGESVLTHGNVATAAVMQQLEDSANAVLKGTVAGLAVPPATAGGAAPEAPAAAAAETPAEIPASKTEAKAEVKEEEKKEAKEVKEEGSGSAAPEEKPAGEASSSEVKESSNIDPAQGSSS